MPSNCNQPFRIGPSGVVVPDKIGMKWPEALQSSGQQPFNRPGKITQREV